MPDLLVELISEDIPARFQPWAEARLGAAAQAALADRGLSFDRIEVLSTPRRLVLAVGGLPERSADTTEERRGPRLTAPAAALQGFMRSTGAGREDLVQRDGFWFAEIGRPGVPTAETLSALVTELIAGMAWPKAMRSAESAFRWVRPLRRILCVFDGAVVPVAIDGLAASDLSEGHRFHAPEVFSARDFVQYREGLARRFVMLSRAERRARIAEGAARICAGAGLALRPDEGLLEELVGMGEWPVPLLGDIDPRFLDLPGELIRTVMRHHQRYFAVLAADGGLAAKFVAVADIEAKDGGSLIAAGCARVLSARLADARFFFDEDRKRTLEAWSERLAGMTFFQSETQKTRAALLESLAGAIAERIGADVAAARRAGLLAKADLATGLVGEFPELQGVVGGYYAAETETAAVAEAIAWQYRPQGPADAVPRAPVAIALSLADKLDLLVGLMLVHGEKASGSRDPYGLRRAALGIIRIVRENGLRVGLRALIGRACETRGLRQGDSEGALLAFIMERLKIALRDAGERHDLLDAALGVGDDDLVRIAMRVRSLADFLGAADGADLLIGYRRAANILAAEKRKGELPAPDQPMAAGAPAEERGLRAALDRAGPLVETALEGDDFAAALAALAGLRAPLDAFFETVLVNAEDPTERLGRLALMMKVGGLMGKVADFSRISG